MNFPFKGIVTVRPYPRLELLQTATWRFITPTTIHFADLYLTRQHVIVRGLFDKPDHHPDDAYPHVIAHGGAHYLHNGHHRVLRVALRGATHMNARIHQIT